MNRRRLKRGNPWEMSDMMDVAGVEDEKEDEVEELMDEMDHHKSKVDCVCDTVKAIAAAQDEVMDDCCDLNCDRAIKELLDPTGDNNLDSVPFVLYCKGDCKPFKGYGTKIETNEEAHFDCFSSFIFRVKEVDDNCCARLELLRVNEEPSGSEDGCKKRDKDPCKQLDGVRVSDLTRTHVCITVDLNDFNGITCLPAVNLD